MKPWLLHVLVVALMALCAPAHGAEVAWPYPDSSLRPLWELLAGGGMSDDRLAEARTQTLASLERPKSAAAAAEARIKLVILVLAGDEVDDRIAREAQSRIDELASADNSPGSRRRADFLRALVQLKLNRPAPAFRILRTLDAGAAPGEQQAAAKLLALVAGWFPDAVDARERARLAALVGPIGHDFQVFPRSAEWEPLGLALHILLMQRYRAAWSDLGNDWMEERVEQQYLGSLAKALSLRDPYAIHRAARSAFDFYDTHFKPQQGWTLLSNVLKRWPVTEDGPTRYEMLAIEAKVHLLNGANDTAMESLRRAIAAVRAYDPATARDRLLQVAQRVETPGAPSLAIAIHQHILDNRNTYFDDDKRLRGQFDSLLELVRLYGLTADFIQVARTVEAARPLAVQLDRRGTPTGGSRLFGARLRLMEVNALELVPSRTLDAAHKLDGLLDELQAVVPIRTQRPDDVLEAVEAAHDIGKAASIEDYLKRKSAAEIQADAFAPSGLVRLRLEQYAEAVPALERALYLDLKKNMVCGSHTQLELWRGLALANAATGYSHASNQWFGEWTNCSGAMSRASVDFAQAMTAYARALVQAKDWVAAEVILKRALRILNTNRNQNVMARVSAEIGLAELAHAQGREADSFDWLTQAAASLQQRSQQDGEWKLQARRVLSLATRDRPGMPALKSKALPIVFSLGQRLNASQASVGLKGFSLRTSIKDPRLSALVQRLLELQRRREALDVRLGSLFSASELSISANLRMRDDLAREADALETQLSQERASLAQFPSYQALISERPLALTDFTQPVKGKWLLQPNEAMVAYFESDDAIHAVVLTRRGAQLILMNAPKKTVAELVTALRASIRIPSSANSPMPAFDASSAFELQRLVWLPIRAAVEPLDSVTIVPVGSLSSLPFEILPVNPPEAGARRWLDDEVTLRYLPSIASISVLGSLPAAAQAQRSAIVFGPPSLPAPATGLPRATVGSFSSYLAKMGDEASADVLCSGKVGNFSPAVNRMARELASGLGKDGARFLAQNQMQKSLLLQLNTSGELARYSHIAFVTHGLVAGKLTDNAYTEPALVFTPATGCQDPHMIASALLTPSEISELTLDADWVLLIACDTATADGTPDSEPLSGFARAFMFAGARALMISHWSVHAEATAALVGFLARDTRQRSRSAALREARTHLRADSQFAHPAYWGGFSVVGADL